MSTTPLVSTAAAQAAADYLKNHPAVVPQVQTEFENRALPLIARGVPVIPVPARSKAAVLPNWQGSATTDRAQVEAWGRQHPDANVASVAKAQIDGTWFFEIDRKDLAAAIQQQTHQVFPKTFIVKSAKGAHFYFKQTAASIQMGNRQAKDANGELWSARVDDRYVIGPQSVHPSGSIYTIHDDHEIVEAPQWLIDFCIANSGSPKTGHAELDSEEIVHEGGRNNALTSILGKARQVLKMDRDQLFEYGKSVNEKRMSLPLPESEVKTIADSIAGYVVKEAAPVIMGGKQVGATAPAAPTELSEEEEQELSRIATEKLRLLEPPEAHVRYGMTLKDYELEKNKPYPVYILPAQPGPKWDDYILYGPAGDVIRKASQYCESHPAGMLVDFLVSIGSMIGRGPYFNIGATKHYCNEFMCRVGDSSKSRKGTGRDAIDDVLKLVDPDWYSDRVTSGFGSGEAIIYQIRDTVTELRQAKPGAPFLPHVNRGVDDKRLCIREGELASVFVLANKSESRASIVIRDGWDGKALRNVVKGKAADGSNNSAKCGLPHLSISGDTTIHELRQKMPDGADENGFGNRFIYVYVYRVKDCPHGGPEIDWTTEVMEFRDLIAAAKQVKHVSMTESARKWWSENYQSFEHDGPEGLAGKMTARGAAHIRRLAMIYALLDWCDEINTVHFQAAKKLWDYCCDSAQFIFNGATKEQQRIVSWIGLRGQVTYAQIYADLYHKHKLVGEIKADLNALVTANMLRFDGRNYSKTGK